MDAWLPRLLQMGCVVSLALVVTAAALTPAEVVRAICPRCESREREKCWRRQPLAAAPSKERPPAPASNATTVDGAQHARRCELETGICATFQAGLWDLLRDHWPRDEQLVVADVGANKGFFSSRALAVFAPGCGVDPNLVRSAVCAYLKSQDLAEEAEGSCNTGYDGAPLPTDGAPCGLDTVVHSFEPSPPLYRMATALQRAVFPGTAQAWRWHGAALSDYEGLSTFHSLWNEGSHLRQRVRGSGRRLTENATSVVVNVTTLDAWTARHGVERIGLLKIDAEGHDFAVLDGASRLLREGRIALLVWEGLQRWPDAQRLDGATLRGPEAYFAAMSRRGLDCYLLSRTRHLLLLGTTAAQLGRTPCPYAGAVENWNSTLGPIAAALGRKPCRQNSTGVGCTDPAKLRSRAIRRYRRARSDYLWRNPVENYACVRRDHALGRAFLEHSLAYQIFSEQGATGEPADAAALMKWRVGSL